MSIKLSRYCLAAAFALSGAFCAGAGAQSLSMSLKLDSGSAPVKEKAAPVIDRCSGLTWAASLGVTCSSETFAAAAARVTTAEAASAGEASEAAGAQGAPEEPPSGGTFAGFGLPTLGSLSAARLLQAAREVPVQAGRAVDLLFRFASKYRLVNSEQGWEVVKFKDVTSENRTQSSGVKGLGVELLFPFE